MYSLKGMRIFIHVAEVGSYAEVGRILGLSASAVAKCINKLETDLGTRLFHRTTRSIGLTQEGLFFYSRGKHILSLINDTNSMMMAKLGDPKGTLHLNIPHIFGHVILLPLLPKFRNNFPDIDLIIDFDDNVVDIIKEGVDVAIRIGELNDSRLICHSIGDQNYVVCGSTHYFKCHGTPLLPSDLVRHACIHFKHPSNGRLANWSFKSPYDALDLPNNIVFNNSFACLSATIDSLGIAHLPVYIAKEAIQLGKLKPILTEFMKPQGKLSLIWPTNRYLSPKIRVFIDFIIEELQANKQLLTLDSHSLN